MDFGGGARRGTRLIGAESFPRRSKPCRTRASSPFDAALPDTRASFSNLVSSTPIPSLDNRLDQAGVVVLDVPHALIHGQGFGVHPTALGQIGFSGLKINTVQLGQRL